MATSSQEEWHPHPHLHTKTNGHTKKLINLSSSQAAAILFATDEWFATAENLLNPTPPIFVPDLFCDQGKVMDGWETRRKRTAGHDWCIIKLSSGLLDDILMSSVVHNDRSFVISMIELDTGYFTGNQAPKVSIEAIKVTRPSRVSNANLLEHDNEDYLYSWLPGASTRLARGGKGIRGTGQSLTTIQAVETACKQVARSSIPNNPHGNWITVLPVTPLQPGFEDSRYHTFEILEDVKQKIKELGGVTHLRLNYFPDGGVARMKVYGYPCEKKIEKKEEVKDSTIEIDKDDIEESSSSNSSLIIHSHNSTNPAPSTLSHPFIELSSETYGGLGLACSNKHYGIPSNLLRPYPGKDMGDGWETARHPNRPSVVSKDPISGLQITPLNDWAVIKLGCGGAKENEGISRIIVDTRHFKGNYPESVTIHGCCAYAANNNQSTTTTTDDDDNDNISSNIISDEEVCKSAGKSSGGGKVEWFPLLKRTLLTADAEHEFTRDKCEQQQLVNVRRGVTHVRISITPDGGLSRVRIYGSPVRQPEVHVHYSHL